MRLREVLKGRLRCNAGRWSGSGGLVNVGGWWAASGDEVSCSRSLCIHFQ